MGIKVLDSFSKGVPDLIGWVQDPYTLEVKFPDLTCEILEGILAKHVNTKTSLSFQDLKLEFARLLARRGSFDF
jgi:hypothetical protein